MCDFCEKFDFGSASYEVDKYGARVIMAGGSYRFPEYRQFLFCPKCGSSRLKENVPNQIERCSKSYCYDTLVQKYREICEEIYRRAVGGVKISDRLLKRRSELETHLCCEHISEEPCWRQGHKLPRETDEIVGFTEKRKRYDK